MTGFDVNLREKFIKKLCENYKFIKCGTIGKSLCNRDIHYLQIGSDKNSVLFAAAFHGMEWLTSLVALKFTERISNAIFTNNFICDVKIEEFLHQNGLVIIPCMNPDGIEISLNGAETAGVYKSLVSQIVKGENSNFWQANARGVDLNHNFNANWEKLHELERKNGIVAPAPTRYGGDTPESEPETKALVKFCEEINFRHVIAFHSQGEEIYWHFGEKTPSEAKKMGLTMSKLSGYKLSNPEGLAVGGGFKDWFIERFSKPGFTVEIGKGRNPLPLEDFTEIYRKLEKMLVYCSIA